MLKCPPAAFSHRSEAQRTEAYVLHSFGKVGFGLRLVDAGNGAIVWKGRHNKVKTYIT
jgi:hypothetical protein